MPELPDIEAYLGALRTRLIGQRLTKSPHRQPVSACAPPTHLCSASKAKLCRELRRVGKRIAFGFENDLWLVLHLMIAGRLHWRPLGAKLGGRQNLAAFDFPDGSLVLTEAGSKRRASLQLFAGEEALASVDPGGIDVFASDLAEFRAVLTSENRTLKRALTDPRFLSGIGNAYSDEILHAAKLSPIALTHKLNDDEWQRLFTATRETIAVLGRTGCVRKPKELSREGHRFPQGHGSAWPLRAALSALRRKDSAHPLRRQRDQLLRALPNRWKSSGRPQPLALDGIGLAAQSGRIGSVEAEVSTQIALRRRGSVQRRDFRLYS